MQFGCTLLLFIRNNGKLFKKDLSRPPLFHSLTVTGQILRINSEIEYMFII